MDDFFDEGMFEKEPPSGRTHILNEMLASIGDLRDRVAKLEVEVQELRFEANFNRVAVLIVFALATDRIWHYFFH